MQGAERLKGLATGSEVVDQEGSPRLNEEQIEELARRVTTDVVERMGQEQFGFWMKDAIITPLIGAGRMYGLCREAEFDDPLEVTTLSLISYKDMTPDQAMRFAEDQEREIVELADAMDETASREELSEKIIQIVRQWAERRGEGPI